MPYRKVAMCIKIRAKKCRILQCKKQRQGGATTEKSLASCHLEKMDMDEIVYARV